MRTGGPRRDEARHPVRPMSDDSKTLTFAVKGVFRITTRFRGTKGDRQVVFESRIVVIDAGSEGAARRTAHKMFARDQWTAIRPAPDVARQSQAFIGISRVVQLAGEMEPGEVWYEFSDESPRIEERARRKVTRRRARGRSTQRR